ncbi:MAG TPA: acyltransferase [Xanthomonadaceae bacterium]|nr:acyltransferase [Xanthomonadaceae bacterium]
MQLGRSERMALGASVATAPHPAGNDRYPALSGLRGLAALGVFAVHVCAFIGLPQIRPGQSMAFVLLAWLPKMGWSGVDVFFTLSAFLLALPYAGAFRDGTPLPGASGYVARRAARILPAYLVQLLVLYGLIALGWASGIVDQPIDATRLLVQPVFAYDLGWPGVATMQTPLVASWWTMPVEIGFYILLPFLVRLLRPGRWPWLLLAIATAWTWRAAILWTQPMSPPIAYLVEHLPGRIDQFAIGMLAAYLFSRAPRVLDWVKDSRADVLFLVAALVFIALPALGFVEGVPVGETPSGYPLLVGWHTYAGIAAAAMLFAAARAAPLVSRFVGCLPLRVLGHISYGLYLWHLPVLLWLHARGGVIAAGSPAIFVFDGLLFSLMAAVLSWQFIERPAMRFAARWSRARMPAPVPASAP